MKRLFLSMLMALSCIAQYSPTKTVSQTQAPDTTAAPSLTRTQGVTISPQDYLVAALDIIENSALNRANVNWPEVRRQAIAMAKDAPKTFYTYEAIRFALRALNDQHSFLATPDEVEARETSTSFEKPVGDLLIGRIGYLHLPRFGASHASALQYAAIAQNHIRALDAQKPCGWIVDLYDNTGGNMWPMLAGVGPILGEGVVGYFVGSDGQKAAWSYEKGKSIIGAQPVITVANPVTLSSPHPNVAVLIGFRTASSGEAIAVAFKGRPNTRFFGMSTYGLSTSNQSFELEDGAMLLLTVAVDADRTGKRYGKVLVPDEQILATKREPVVKAAAQWLTSQPACKR